jgi:hypothetical protein
MGSMQCNVEFGGQLNICSRTKESRGKPWSSWSVAYKSPVLCGRHIKRSGPQRKHHALTVLYRPLHSNSCLFQYFRNNELYTNTRFIIETMRLLLRVAAEVDSWTNAEECPFILLCSAIQDVCTADSRRLLLTAAAPVWLWRLRNLSVQINWSSRLATFHFTCSVQCRVGRYVSTVIQPAPLLAMINCTPSVLFITELFPHFSSIWCSFCET